MLLLLLFSVASASAANNSVTFTIETTWDGKPISWNPATVTLSTTEPEGDLRVEVSAPFFNSPKLREDLWLGNGCPERPHRYLYNYEVSSWIIKYLSYLLFPGCQEERQQRK